MDKKLYIVNFKSLVHGAAGVYLSGCKLDADENNIIADVFGHSIRRGCVIPLDKVKDITVSALVNRWVVWDAGKDSMDRLKYIIKHKTVEEE